MLAYSLVGFVASAEGLAPSAAQTQREGFGGVAPHIFATKHTELLAVGYQRAVGHSGVRLGEAEHIHGIEQVALAHAVVAHQAVYLWREGQRGLPDILEVGYVKRVQ